MKLQTLAFSILSASCLAVAASNGLAQPGPASPSTTQNSNRERLDANDRSFLENAAQSGHAEIQGSQLAQNKAKSPDVKAFASQMIQDHTKVGEELTALAKQKGYTPPSEPSLMQKAELKTLGMTDDSFDKMYASRIGVSAHESAVKLFKEAANKAKDPDIKAFAAKHTPELEHHLEMARALQQKAGGGK